jgi:hypothetical protein
MWRSGTGLRYRIYPNTFIIYDDPNPTDHLPAHKRSDARVYSTVEETEVSVSKTRTENCASLIFELKIAQCDVLSSFSTLKTLATDWNLEGSI